MDMSLVFFLGQDFLVLMEDTLILSLKNTLPISSYVTRRHESCIYESNSLFQINPLKKKTTLIFDLTFSRCELLLIHSGRMSELKWSFILFH